MIAKVIIYSFFNIYFLARNKFIIKIKSIEILTAMLAFLCDFVLRNYCLFYFYSFAKNIIYISIADKTTTKMIEISLIIPEAKVHY